MRIGGSVAEKLLTRLFCSFLQVLRQLLAALNDVLEVCLTRTSNCPSPPFGFDTGIQILDQVKSSAWSDSRWGHAWSLWSSLQGGVYSRPNHATLDPTSFCWDEWPCNSSHKMTKWTSHLCNMTQNDVNLKRLFGRLCWEPAVRGRSRGFSSFAAVHFTAAGDC